MAAFEKNQYKTLALACVIWLPVIVVLSPPMNSAVFIMITASGAWFSKGSVEVSYYYKANFEQERLSWPHLIVAALLVPVWFWCLNYRKPYK